MVCLHGNPLTCKLLASASAETLLKAWSGVEACKRFQLSFNFPGDPYSRPQKASSELSWAQRLDLEVSAGFDSL